MAATDWSPVQLCLEVLPAHGVMLLTLLLAVPESLRVACVHGRSIVACLYDILSLICLFAKEQKHSQSMSLMN